MPDATYRLAINGFTCLSETWDDAMNADGQHDEVFFRVNTKVADGAGAVKANSDVDSVVMGDIQGFSNRIQVGSAHGFLGRTTGGIISGDSYPTPTPYIRSADLDAKAAADRRLFPPYTIWEGDLSEADTDVVFVTPTIWEWDPGSGAADGWLEWQKNTDAKFGARAKDIYGGVYPVAKPVFDMVSLGIQTFATLAGLWSPFGKSMRRPIGAAARPSQP
jgi:hypothetical protein